MTYSFFGGLNYADDPAALLRRSHALVEGGWQQRIDARGRMVGVEAAGGQNFDLMRGNLTKRKGQTSNADLTTTLDGVSSTVDADSASGQAVLNVAATTGFKVGGSVVVNRGGAREETKIIGSISAGVSLTFTTNLAFAHTAAQADAVEQYVWLAGDTAVLGPVEVRLPATNAFARFLVSEKTIYTDQSGAWRQINDSASSPYTHSDASVTAATAVVLDGGVFFGLDGTNKIQRYRSGANLDPAMNNGNAYTDAGGTGRTITGTWGTGYDRLAVLNGRLVFNDGTSTVQYTDVNQPWDLAGGGNLPASGQVVALRSHVPKFGDALSALLFVGTGIGWEFTSDLASVSTVEGSPPPMSNKTAISSRNWILYLSDQGELVGINGNRVIDLGRRLRARDAASGPLDQINLANSLSVANAVYNPRKQQAVWLISTAASGDPDTGVVIDLELGEPELDEPLESFEQRVRLLHWTGLDFVGMGVTRSGLVGARSGGTLWALDSGYADFAASAIAAQWDGPVLDGAAPVRDKNWMLWFGRGLNAGNWAVQADFLLDRDTVSAKSASFNQGAGTSTYGTATYGSGTYGGEGIVQGSDDVDLIGEALQLRLTQGGLSEFFVLTGIEQRYSLLREER